MRYMVAVHYQIHCPVCIAAWEGCHRVYTAAVAVESVYPSINLPVEIGNNGNQKGEAPPANSPIFD